MNILVNAYAVSPNWGSEQGMGWNWVTNLAKFCHLDVITEGEWQSEIELALASLPQKDNLTFHYLPVPPKVRQMCWNQGDWRFYWHYRRWQLRALRKAQEIVSQKHIDVIHQLNMIGFREPGYLWKIKNIPFIWGPIGGMELMPLDYLKGAPLKQRVFNCIKNVINRYQCSHSRRVKKAIQRSSELIAAVKGVKDVLSSRYGRDSYLINETGVSLVYGGDSEDLTPSDKLKIVWVGKFDFRKQLPLALRTMIEVDSNNVELHICGTGNEKAVKEMKSIIETANIGHRVIWHGNVPHDRITEIMSQCHLLFFTSIMEATSTVVLEALSVNLPVLCFNTCGFGPIVNEFGGWTIELSTPRQSVLDFASKIKYFMNNPDELAMARDRISDKRQNLTWEHKARQVYELYQSLPR